MVKAVWFYLSKNWENQPEYSGLYIKTRDIAIYAVYDNAKFSGKI